MGAAHLPEILEGDAVGTVAETYADMRRVLGLPLVNTVYRVLAVDPGRIEALWAELRPNLLQPAVREAADELGAAEPLPVEPLPAAALAVTALDAGASASTLAAYRRGNSRNAIALAALLAGAPGRGGAGPEAVDGEPPAILPMTGLGSLAPATLSLLEEMSEPIGGGERPLLVPGLLRHFAADPALLALLWTALRPALRDGSLADRAAAVWAQAETAAAALPFPVTRLPEGEARAVVQRFSGAIPRMLVVGATLERTLGILST